MNRLINNFLMVFAVTLLVAVQISFSMSPAHADDKQCLVEAFSATGKASSIGELARANAFFTWKASVKATHGADYMAWSAATERKLLCIDLMSGENKGKWECTRTARPCKTVKPVAATKGSCKEEVVSGWGARRGSAAKARLEAQAGWKLLVEGSLGTEWSDWSLAKETTIKCLRKNRYQFQCIASAKACHS